MPKDTNLEIFRALAVIGVIAIHVTSAYLFIFNSRGSLNWNLKIIFDRTARFSVPLFVGLSGFLLAKKYSRIRLSLPVFYLRRVLRLLPWYLFWSLILYFAFRWQSESLKRIIFLGRGDYHLYFVPMIFQLYLLFPALLWLTRKTGLFFMLVVFVWEVIFYQLIAQKTETISNNNGFWPDQNQYVFFGTWVFYFVLGIFFGLRNPSQQFVRHFLRWLSVVLIIAGLFWSVVYSFNLLNQGMNLVVATRFTQLPVLIFSGGVIIFLLTVSRRLNFSHPLQNFLVVLGEKSYLVYLLHTGVLRVSFDTLKIQKLVPFPIVLFLEIGTAFLVASVLDLIVKKGFSFIKSYVVRLH